MNTPDPGSLSTVMDNNAGIVTAQGFPHGVRCMDCHDPIPEGAAYISRTADCPHGDVLCVHGEIVCVACGVTR